MPVPLRPACLVLAAAVASWAAGHAAQPGGPKQPPPPFTAFPEIVAPMREVPDFDKALGRLTAGHPRPVPTDAPPLVKVRTAQVNAGVNCLSDMLRRVWIGNYVP